MNMDMQTELQIGNAIQMRKQHPCGSDIWIIYRVGADIGLRCAGCDRRVIMPRKTFLKRVKKILENSESKGK